MSITQNRFYSLIFSYSKGKGENNVKDEPVHQGHIIFSGLSGICIRKN
jgi:hypothetical protein